MQDRNKAINRPMPMGNPGDFPIGSAESRARARAMLDAMPLTAEDIESMPEEERHYLLVSLYIKAANRAHGRTCGVVLKREEFFKVCASEDSQYPVNHWRGWPLDCPPTERSKIETKRAWHHLEDYAIGSPHFEALNSFGDEPSRPFILTAIALDTRNTKLIPVPAVDEAVRVIESNQIYWCKATIKEHTDCGWTIKECTEEGGTIRAVLIKNLKPSIQ